MYSFDEHGNALVDASLRDAVVKHLNSGRNFSPRFHAIHRSGVSNAITELVNKFRNSVMSPIVDNIQNVCREHKVLTGRNASLLQYFGNGRNPNRIIESIRTDLINATGSATTRFLSSALKGFEGPLPIKVENNKVIWFSVADVSLLRYLRMLSHRLERHGIQMVSEVYATEDVGALQFNDTRIRPRDGSMYLSIQIVPYNSLAGILGFSEVARNLQRVVRTLSRRVVSVDGRFGEYSKWLMPDFRRRIARHASNVMSIDDDHISGRSPYLRDRGVLVQAEERHRHVITNASGQGTPEGGFQWR